MSRYYEIKVIVKNFNPEKLEDIKQAIVTLWPEVDQWEYTKDRLECSAEGSLGCKSDEDLAFELNNAVNDANEVDVAMQVTATYLEDLPQETWEFTDIEGLDVDFELQVGADGNFPEPIPQGPHHYQVGMLMVFGDHHVYVYNPIKSDEPLTDEDRKRIMREEVCVDPSAWDEGSEGYWFDCYMIQWKGEKTISKQQYDTLLSVQNKQMDF